MIPELRRLLDHARWADRLLLDALKGTPDAPAPAWKELAHVVGAAELWLARLERRPARTGVWPELPAVGVEALAEHVHDGYAAYLSRLTEGGLGELCAYTNSAGRPFETPVGEILLHVALHGQYHRGKVNVLLRQAGLAPAPTDYIAFVRGVPAATTPPR